MNPCQSCSEPIVGRSRGALFCLRCVRSGRGGRRKPVLGRRLSEEDCAEMLRKMPPLDAAQWRTSKQEIHDLLTARDPQEVQMPVIIR